MQVMAYSGIRLILVLLGLDTARLDFAVPASSERHYNPGLAERALDYNGGEGGIRTPDTGFILYNDLANRRLQPLGHLSADGGV